MIKRSVPMAWLLFASALLFLSGCSRHAQSAEQEPKDLQIVSQLPSLTEICFALGLSEQVVGVTEFCRYPPEAALKPKIGGIINPSYEKVVSLRPDLILVQQNLTDQIARYRELNLNVLAIRVKTIEDVYESIRKIGEATRRRSQAEKLIADIRSEFDAIHARYKKRKPLKALLVVGHDPGSLQSIYVAGKQTFLGQLLEMVGGKNVIGDNPIDFPIYSKEEIIKRSPEVIIIISERSVSFAEGIKKERELWSQLGYIDAVKNDRICLLQEDYMLIPGPRMHMAARDMARCLFEEKQSPDPSGAP